MQSLYKNPRDFATRVNAGSQFTGEEDDLSGTKGGLWRFSKRFGVPFFGVKCGPEPKNWALSLVMMGGSEIELESGVGSTETDIVASQETLRRLASLPARTALKFVTTGATATMRADLNVQPISRR